MSRPSAKRIRMACGRGVADDVPTGQHVVLVFQLDNHARAGFFQVLAVAVLAAGVGGDVGLDVDHRRPDELGDDLHDGRLGLEDFDVPLQFPPQFRPLFGPGVARLFKGRRQGRGRLRMAAAARHGRAETKQRRKADGERPKATAIGQWSLQNLPLANGQ